VGDQVGIGGTPEQGDYFGASLAAGDFDDDGFDDQAIGASGEDIGTLENAGQVNVLYGSAGVGLTEVGYQVWHQNVAGIGGTAEDYDHFGESLTAGDFDDDGFDDLAIGAPYEDIDAITNGGGVNVLYGSAGVGLTEAGDQVWHQDVEGVGGTAETGDAFGKL
jgi:hypothetical protein